MKLEELKRVLRSLTELVPLAEDQSKMTADRQTEAIQIVNQAIKKAIVKEAEFDKIKLEIEEFIAEHDMSNRHYLDDAVIIEYFDYYTPKQVKKALKELR